MPVCIQQSTKRVLHRPRRRCVDMTFHGGEMDDVLSEEQVRNPNPFRINLVEDQERGFGLVLHPCHIPLFEIELHGDPVFLEQRNILVEVLSLESIRHDSLILDADKVFESRPLQSQDRPFELPGSCVGAGKRFSAPRYGRR